MPLSVQEAPLGKARFAISLHIQTASGHVSRRGTYHRRTLHAARAVIRNHGFTILEAYAAASGHWHADFLPPGFTVQKLQAVRAAWHAANTAASQVWSATAPANCPRWPALRLVVAVRAARQ
jgi:hypothetical protein